MSTWTAANVGDQGGRTAVVTGANTGIGLEAARVLAARGAHVVLACRDRARAGAAAALLTGPHPPAVVELDLASLASVGRAAEWIAERYSRLDLLVNNAGVMMTPQGATADGFERQLGTNHLGHFALTGLLLDRLRDTPGSRVVTMSSSANRGDGFDIDDLHFRRRRYRRTAAYAQSKLANVMFTRELHRRLEAGGAETIAVACEPGVTPTRLSRYTPVPMRLAVWAVTRAIGQPDAATGALCLLRAATDPDIRGGAYVGPDGRPPLRPSGPPVKLDPPEFDPATARRLWEESERLTSVHYTTLTR